MVFTYPMECFVARHSLHSLLFLHAPGLVGGGAVSAVQGESLEEDEDEGKGERRAIEIDCIDDIVLDRVLEEQEEKESSRNAKEEGREMSPLSSSQHIVGTLALWGSSLLLSLVVSDLHLILALTGAVAASFLAYILPALLYFKTYEAYWLKARAGFDPASNHYQPSVVRRIRKLRRFVFPFFLLTFGILSLVIGVGTVIYEIVGG